MKNNFFIVLTLVFWNHCATGNKQESAQSSVPAEIQVYESKWNSVKVKLNVPSLFTEVPVEENPNLSYDRSFLSEDKKTEIRYYVHDFSRYGSEKGPADFYQTKQGFLLDLSTIWANTTGNKPDSMRVMDLDSFGGIIFNSNRAVATAAVKPSSDFGKGYENLVIHKIQKRDRGDIFIFCLTKNKDDSSVQRSIATCMNSAKFE